MTTTHMNYTHLPLETPCTHLLIMHTMMYVHDEPFEHTLPTVVDVSYYKVREL
jgi:hypothetical protein